MSPLTPPCALAGRGKRRGLLIPLSLSSLCALCALWCILIESCTLVYERTHARWD